MARTTGATLPVRYACGASPFSESMPASMPKPNQHTQSRWAGDRHFQTHIARPIGNRAPVIGSSMGWCGSACLGSNRR